MISTYLSRCYHNCDVANSVFLTDLLFPDNIVGKHVYIAPLTNAGSIVIIVLFITLFKAGIYT